MKKIAFFVQWMLCGGVENTLITLCDKLDKKIYEITIYVIVEKGEFIDKIPSGVKLVQIPMSSDIRESIPVGGIKIACREAIYQRKYVKAAKMIANRILINDKFSELSCHKSKIPNLDKKYDIAVNYHIHSPFLVWYLAERVQAKKKYTWIHNDFTTTNYQINDLKIYLNRIDLFFCVSIKLKKEFEQIFPQYRDKTIVAKNIIPIKRIQQLGNEYYPLEYSENKFIILTVGRIEMRKGYDIAVEVADKLKKSGYEFEWYIIGDGTEKNRIQKMIIQKKLTDCIHLLGVRDNPYPYFKNCDLYVQTSRHEGYVTTVTEAKIFNRPIICTNVSGANEQILSGYTGDVVEISAEKIENKIKYLIDNNEKRKMYTENLQKEGVNEDNDWFQRYF